MIGAEIQLFPDGGPDFLKRVHAPVLALLMLVAACSPSSGPEDRIQSSHPDLKAHTEEFRQEIVRVTEGVYVAVGFGLANSVLLEGDDGVVIVDTLESAEAARPVKQAFKAITAKPVKAIIYTHHHSDHTFGAAVMAGEDRPEIYSHAETQRHLNRITTLTRETTYRRAMRQFGTLLPEGQFVNAGIGPRLQYDDRKTAALLFPTRTFADEELEIEIAGLKIVLVHAPGETPDQIFLWLPEKRVLLPADNFYKAFPNLYAIRGTAYRDVALWVKSLDKMRELRAEFLVPHHSRPIVGSDTVYETLTHYRDAIQFVHDQTIRWMNTGLGPLEIAERVKLPAHLAAQPYLQEYYGTVAWSVRAIFDGYLGWFGGNATDLFPLGPEERANRMARLAGGEMELHAHARRAMEEKDYPWALELSDQLLRLDPRRDEYRQVKAAALRALGEMQIAATARNYYLTQAMEVEDTLRIPMMKNTDLELIHRIPLESIFNGMAVRLNPEKSARVDTIAGFRFPDTGEAYTVHVRRGVTEIQPRFPENPAVTVSVDSKVWKEIAAGVRSPAVAMMKDMEVGGGRFDLIQFMSLFKNE
jgi:alkyl sulfatase BDS1-like metallo-beta-lactamase superfamily hydrolase